MRDAVVGVWITAVAGWAGLAHAQPAAVQAEALFRQGKDLMAAGQVAEACAAFDASQRIDPKPTTLLNQANCREKNGQLATAWGLFLEGARQTRGATDRASQQMHAVATDRAAQLQARLPTLSIDVPPGSRVEGLEILRDGEVLDLVNWNRALPIDGGTHHIVARAPGYTEWSGTAVVEAEHDARTIEVPKLRSAAPAGSARVEGASADRAPAPPSVQEASGSGARWSTRRKLALGVAGGGALALAVGGVLGVSAKNRQREAHGLCPDPQLACDDADRANELVRFGHDRAIGANVAFGIAGAAALTAGVLWLTGAPEAGRRIAVVPIASPAQLFVTASGSF